MSKLKDRIEQLEARLIHSEPKRIFISPAEPDTPPVESWSCLQSGVTVSRLDGETDEALQERAVAADDEARKSGAGADWPISVFFSRGPGWSY